MEFVDYKIIKHYQTASIKIYSNPVFSSATLIIKIFHVPLPPENGKPEGNSPVQKYTTGRYHQLDLATKSCSEFWKIKAHLNKALNQHYNQEFYHLGEIFQITQVWKIEPMSLELGYVYFEKFVWSMLLLIKKQHSTNMNHSSIIKSNQDFPPRHGYI